jgi:hypothetical protein
MTKEEFTKTLEKKRYSYRIEGEKIVVTHERAVNLSDLTFLPPGVEFRNGGSVFLHKLTSLPPGVVFKNKGPVNLRSLVGGWFDDLEINIKGVGSNRLLNLMIKQGVFI